MKITRYEVSVSTGGSRISVWDTQAHQAISYHRTVQEARDQAAALNNDSEGKE